MTTATASWLRSKDFADVAFVLFVEGVDVGWTTHSDVAALQDRWIFFGRNVLRGGLTISGAIERTLTPFQSEVTPSSLTFVVLDTEADALAGLMQKASNSASPSLNNTIGPADTLVNLDRNPFVVGDYAYIGTETVRVDYLLGPESLNVVRGQFGLFGTLNNRTYGRRHTVDSQTGYKPHVTQTPTTWINRTVALYVCYKGPEGFWSAGFPGQSLGTINDSELLWAGRIKGFVDSGDGQISLSCQEVTESLSSTIGAGLFEAEAEEGITIPASWADITVQVSKFDDTAQIFYTAGLAQLSIADTHVTHQEVAASINEQLSAWFLTAAGTYGPAGASMGIALGNGTGGPSYTITYKDPAAAVSPQWEIRIGLSFGVWTLLGWDATTWPDVQTGSAAGGLVEWNRIDSGFTAGTTFTDTATGPPLKFFNDNPAGETTFRLSVRNVTSGTAYVPQASVPARYSGADGFLLVGDSMFAVFQLSATTWRILAGVTSSLAGSVAGVLDIRNTVAFGRVPDDGSGNPIKVRQVWIEQTTIGEALLAMMLSTGTAGYGHPIYDRLPAGMGLAIPAELIDINSFLTNSDAYVIFVPKPRPFQALLESAMNFLGRHCLFKDGRITSVTTGEVGVGSSTLIELTEANKAKQIANGEAKSSLPLRTTVSFNPSGIINRATLRYNFGIDEKFGRTITVNAIDSQTDHGQVRAAVVDAYGIYEDVDVFPGGSSVTWQRDVAATELAYFSKAVAVAERTFDFSLATVLYPGAKVSVTDSAIVDPATGIRGVAGLRGWVIKTVFDWKSGVGKVAFAYNPFNQQDRQGLWAPSARVDEDYNASGFVAGYNSSTKQLRVKPHEYSPESDPVDISNFAAAYAVRVVDLSPTSSSAPTEWVDVLASVDVANHLATLTTGLPTWTGTGKFVLEFGTIANSTAAQRLKYAYIADASTLSTGNAANDAYQWAGPVEDSPDGAVDLRQRYRKANLEADDVGTPMSVHKAHEIRDWVNSAGNYHTAPVYINEQISDPQHVSSIGTTWTTVFGPVWINLVSRRSLRVRLLVSNTKVSGSPEIRAVTSRMIMRSDGADSDFRDPIYFEGTSDGNHFTTFLLTAANATPTWFTYVITQPSSGQIGLPGCWFTVDSRSGTDKSDEVVLYGVYLAEEPTSPANPPSYLNWYPIMQDAQPRRRTWRPTGGVIRPPRILP